MSCAVRRQADPAGAQAASAGFASIRDLYSPEPVVAAVFPVAALAAAKPVEAQLWSTLGITIEPVECLVVPVMVKQRAVNLIYVHQIGASPDPQLITELSDLAARVQASYMRLIKQARGS